MKEYILIFLGGGMGSILRYSISKWIPYTENTFPWATFFANIAACLVFSIAFSYILKLTSYNNEYKLFIITGFCGGFSTFSTFSFELFKLLHTYQYLMAFMYAFSSILIGLATIYIIMKFFN